MLRASRVRILAIETSGPRGSVALLSGDEIIVGLEHEHENAHAEHILPLVQRALETAGIAKQSLERIAVGVGPGSFTGLRVGIALAEGLSLGLDIPLLGVASLRAMAASVTSGSELRVPVLDARRGEAFVAAYSADGSERLAPCALPVDQVQGHLETLGEPYVLVGGFSRSLGAAADRLEGREYDQPSARWVGVVASRLDPGQHPAEPIYVRGAGATLPNLPPSPISTSPPGSG